jgi:hypothetical protein
MLRQVIISAVRTGVQAAVGLAAAWLLQRGVDIDQDALLAAVDAGIIGAVTLLMRYAEEKLPVLRWVFSLGLTSAVPSYVGKHAG